MLNKYLKKKKKRNQSDPIREFSFSPIDCFIIPMKSMKYVARIMIVIWNSGIHRPINKTTTREDPAFDLAHVPAADLGFFSPFPDSNPPKIFLQVPNNAELKTNNASPSKETESPRNERNIKRDGKRKYKHVYRGERAN